MYPRHHTVIFVKTQNISANPRHRCFNTSLVKSKFIPEYLTFYFLIFYRKLSPVVILFANGATVLLSMSYFQNAKMVQM